MGSRVGWWQELRLMARKWPCDWGKNHTLSIPAERPQRPGVTWRCPWCCRLCRLAQPRELPPTARLVGSLGGPGHLWSGWGQANAGERGWGPGWSPFSQQLSAAHVATALPRLAAVVAPRKADSRGGTYSHPGPPARSFFTEAGGLCASSLLRSRAMCTCRSAPGPGGLRSVRQRQPRRSSEGG